MLNAYVVRSYRLHTFCFAHFLWNVFFIFQYSFERFVPRAPELNWINAIKTTFCSAQTSLHSKMELEIVSCVWINLRAFKHHLFPWLQLFTSTSLLFQHRCFLRFFLSLYENLFYINSYAIWFSREKRTIYVWGVFIY